MISRRQLLGNSLVALASASVFPVGAKPTLSVRATRTHYDSVLNATLPTGCELRAVARVGEVVGRSGYRWHGLPDGGACFDRSDGGWVYVSNSELGEGKGGVGAIRFDRHGEIIDAYSILEGSSRNCAGGRTPWGTWLSCEENGDAGQVYECDPNGGSAILRPGLGACNHEAAAVDPRSHQVYLTEDITGGCLYRFSPARKQDLSEGKLEVAVVDGMTLRWEGPLDVFSRDVPLRYQLPHAARFHGGEGIVYANRHVYFTTKKDNRVWSLHLDTGRLSVVYDAALYDEPILTGVDNIEVSQDGELLIAEDGGDMQIVVLDRNYRAVPLVTLHDQDGSEIAGPAFTPDGSRLLFSSQRGPRGEEYGGVTYELTIPG